MLDALIVFVAVIVWFGLLAIFVGGVWFSIYTLSQMDPVGAADEIAERLYRISRSQR